jgi:hypothetical protein
MLCNIDCKDKKKALIEYSGSLACACGQSRPRWPSPSYCVLLMGENVSSINCNDSATLLTTNTYPR